MSREGKNSHYVHCPVAEGLRLEIKRYDVLTTMTVPIAFSDDSWMDIKGKNSLLIVNGSVFGSKLTEDHLYLQLKLSLEFISKNPHIFKYIPGVS